ncbi:MAG: hypothetical protein BWY59_00891 [Verrucomicrobia bacterium ADurb.Bin345]|nr:MAG: hypothetical protein BWY59_00891 [Verrucomicrobia bacterium ADurb.Bin345]
MVTEVFGCGEWTISGSAPTLRTTGTRDVGCDGSEDRKTRLLAKRIPCVMPAELKARLRFVAACPASDPLVELTTSHVLVPSSGETMMSSTNQPCAR